MRRDRPPLRPRARPRGDARRALGDDLRALLAAWDAEHPGAVGERYAASVGGSVWTVVEERGDDFVMRGERGEAWAVSRDYLAAEVRAGRMRPIA